MVFQSSNTGTNTNNGLLKAVITICCVGIVVLSGLLIISLVGGGLHDSNHSRVAQRIYDASGITALQDANPDVVATYRFGKDGASGAICQRAEKESYYESHNVAGEKSKIGCAHLDLNNRIDFTHAVSVVYGENDPEVFGPLTQYQADGYLDDHAEFTVCASGHVRTYRVVSAYTTSDSDFLRHYGYFATYDQLRDFEADIQAPDALISQMASEDTLKDIALDDDSKFVVMASYDKEALASGLFVVVGVCVDDRTVE